MRIPDALTNSVAFLGYRNVAHDASTEVYAGTGFIVAIDFEDVLFPYLVTADHVAAQLEKFEDPIYRFNDLDGRGHVAGLPRKGPFENTPDPWYRHASDPVADVAVRAFLPKMDMERAGDRTPYGGMPYTPERTFVEPEDFKKDGIGIGDEVFTAGLFSFVSGQRSNSPIIRTGNLAMLPAERIVSERGRMEAYLIEARSIAALSGSPVFVRRTVTLGKSAKRGDGPNVAQAAGADFKLLGVMHGHWKIDVTDINTAGNFKVPDVGVNVGIASVTPTFKIREALYSKHLVAAREALVESRRRQGKTRKTMGIRKWLASTWSKVKGKDA
jgi:hypothetical protein